MGEPDDMTTPAVPAQSDRLNWRDMLRALESAESRIITAVKTELTPISTMVYDHEARLRVIEAKGSSEAQEAIEKASTLAIQQGLLDGRVGTIESERKTERDLRAGAFNVLNMSRKAVLGGVAVLVAVAAGISIVGDAVANALGFIK